LECKKGISVKLGIVISQNVDEDSLLKKNVQSVLVDFLGDLRLADFFSCFSMDLDNFQDKMAEIMKSGVKNAAKYDKNVHGSLATQMMKLFNIPSHVFGSVFN
jgi:hypothetical protein